MKPEAQRIAIAEFCGWKNWDLSPQQDHAWMTPLGATADVRDIPDYLTNLNAMYEVEKLLRDENGNDQWSRYTIELNRICCRIKCGDNPLCGYTIHATAAQRAEALLKTIGKWEESK